MPRPVLTTVAVEPGRRLRLVVVSDTHSEPHPAAFDLIRREAPDRILHGGDIGDLHVLDRLEEIAPVLAVRGNIDGAGGAPEARRIAFVEGERTLATILLLHHGVDGPRLRREALEAARACGAGLVVCGHSHVPLVASTRGVGVFNPGSIGPRRFRLPVTFGVIDLGAAGLSLRHVDCETGARWLPGTSPGPVAGGGAQPTLR